uniref:Putative RNA ligase n=1 Tax=viral metagenome TaxID=1070528 RepID=A0A6M3LUJ7_9ZZZZ
MTEYHKIDSVYMRDPATNHRTFLTGEWSRPEFGYLADLDWVWTEKIDGTNIRIHLFSDGDFSIRGRTDKADVPAHLLAPLDQIACDGWDRGIRDDLILYGEGYGPKVQGGGWYRDDHGFILFDVATPGGMFLERHNVEDLAATLGVPVVPIVGHGLLVDAVHRVEDGMNPSVVAGTTGRQAEGLVMRPAVELLDRRGRRVITKVKAKDFPQ